jgi:D-alanyl-lipoteichoic acid acyltransferase DltB (MBOAT superfamily)
LFAARTVSPGWERALRWLGVAVTFNFVALGWIWFVLPSPETGVRVFLSMFGMHLP